MLTALCLLVSVLAAWCGWRSLWHSLARSLRNEYAAVLAVSSLQALLTGLSYPLAAALCSGPPEEGYYRENCLLEWASLSAAAGYFLFESPLWEPRLSLHYAVRMAHHAGALILLAGVLLHGKGAFAVIHLSAIMELNTPLLLIRYYLRGRQRLWAEAAYLVSFVLLRLVLCVRRSLEMSCDTRLPQALQAAAVLGFLTSVGLLPGVVRTLCRCRTSRDDGHCSRFPGLSGTRLRRGATH